MTQITMPVEGPFSLAAAAGFGFGPNAGRTSQAGEPFRLAFVTDDLQHQAGVVLTQNADGSLSAELSGDADPDATEAQIRRILSIGVDPAGWLAAGRADPVLGQVQAAFPGLRPVLFHSPYEAAAWAMLSHRRNRVQATAVRRRLSEAAGVTFTLAGEQWPAFPLPQRLLEVSSFPGLEDQRMARLHGVARAALDGQLDATEIAALEPDAAAKALQQIKGLGPFYAMLVYLRSAGVTDELAVNEPRLAGALRHFYALATTPDAAEIGRLAEPWRPFRTWAGVLFRVAGDRAEVAFE
jgi:DNA-3-methyladenine glycosylase II